MVLIDTISLFSRLRGIRLLKGLDISLSYHILKSLIFNTENKCKCLFSNTSNLWVISEPLCKYIFETYSCMILLRYSHVSNCCNDRSDFGLKEALRMPRCILLKYFSRSVLSQIAASNALKSFRLQPTTHSQTRWVKTSSGSDPKSWKVMINIWWQNPVRNDNLKSLTKHEKTIIFTYIQFSSPVKFGQSCC